MRIFGVDKVSEDRDADMVIALVRKIVSLMIKDRLYLSLKPSKIGAASVLLALNILDSPVAPSINL